MAAFSATILGVHLGTSLDTRRRRKLVDHGLNCITGRKAERAESILVTDLAKNGSRLAKLSWPKEIGNDHQRAIEIIRSMTSSSPRLSTDIGVGQNATGPRIWTASGSAVS